MACRAGDFFRRLGFYGGAVALALPLVTIGAIAMASEPADGFSTTERAVIATFDALRTSDNVAYTFDAPVGADRTAFAAAIGGVMASIRGTSDYVHNTWWMCADDHVRELNAYKSSAFVVNAKGKVTYPHDQLVKGMLPAPFGDGSIADVFVVHKDFPATTGWSNSMWSAAPANGTAAATYWAKKTSAAGGWADESATSSVASHLRGCKLMPF